jgi:hypothetical protein
MSDQTPTTRENIKAQAAKLSALLVEAWNEDFRNVFGGAQEYEEQYYDIAGLAVAHAVHMGWVEPDPSDEGVARILLGAERLLKSRGLLDE